MNFRKHRQQAPSVQSLCSERQAAWCGQNFGCSIGSSRKSGQNVGRGQTVQEVEYTRIRH